MKNVDRPRAVGTGRIFDSRKARDRQTWSQIRRQHPRQWTNQQRDPPSFHSGNFKQINSKIFQIKISKLFLATSFAYFLLIFSLDLRGKRSAGLVGRSVNLIDRSRRNHGPTVWGTWVVSSGRITCQRIQHKSKQILSQLRACIWSQMGRNLNGDDFCQ